MQTVLAVDDSQAMLNMVRQTLEFGGYQVITASDGMQALERLRRRRHRWWSRTSICR